MFKTLTSNLPAAPKLTRQQPRHPLQVQRPEREAHRRDHQAIPRPVQKGRRHAPAGPRPAPARLHQHQRHERGRPPARDAPHASLRGRLLLHHVQPHSRGQVFCPGLHNGTHFQTSLTFEKNRGAASLFKTYK